MNKDTVTEFSKDCNSVEDLREKYIYKLQIIYDNFSNKMKTWDLFKSAKNRILSHSLTYGDPEALEIQVAFYQIALYSNFINQSYISNQYKKLGIDNFFSNIESVIGPIRFFTLDEINANKAYIIDNTELILNGAEGLYQKLINYVAMDAKMYVARIEWFLSVCSVVQSIVFTAEYALRSYLYDDKDDVDKFMQNIKKSTGFLFTEVPTEVSTLGKDGE